MKYYEVAQHILSKHPVLITVVSLSVIFVALMMFDASRQVDEFTADYPEEE